MKFEQSLINKFEGGRLSAFLEPLIPNYNGKLIETKNIGKVGKESIQIVLNKYINSFNDTGGCGDLVDNGDNVVDEPNAEDANIETEEELIDYTDSIERAFFLFLFFQDQDTYYHKKIIGSQDLSTLWNRLENNDDFSGYLNKKLYDLENDRGILSIRKEQNDLLILFNFGTYTTLKRREEKKFLVSCRINLDNNILSIGIKDSMFSKISDEDKAVFGNKRYDLIQYILGKILEMGLGLRFEKYNGQELEKALYDLFNDQSKKAEELIKRSFEEEDDENISVEDLKKEAEEFLTENFLLKQPEKFIEKALTMKYQDQAAQMPTSTFINNGGYIFGFSFVEKQITRSDNKTDKKKPIYETKLYWNLKEIIEEHSNLSQLSMYWKFNKNDFSKTISESKPSDLSFVEVDYKNSNNELILHYYVNDSHGAIDEESSFDRRRREDYALRQIIEYLSQK